MANEQGRPVAARKISANLTGDHRPPLRVFSGENKQNKEVET